MSEALTESWPYSYLGSQRRDPAETQASFDHLCQSHTNPAAPGMLSSARSEADYSS